MVQYEPDIPAALVDGLGRLAHGLHARLVLTPDRSGMPFAVAATAWHRLLGCSRIDGRVIEALRTFASRYAGQGPDV